MSNKLKTVDIIIPSDDTAYSGQITEQTLNDYVSPDNHNLGGVQIIRFIGRFGIMGVMIFSGVSDQGTNCIYGHGTLYSYYNNVDKTNILFVDYCSCILYINIEWNSHKFKHMQINDSNHQYINKGGYI